MGDFQEFLCGCLTDICSCFVAFLLPDIGGSCLQGNAVAKATGEGCCCPCLCACLCPCIGGALNRTKVREKYSIQGSCYVDCLVMMFCFPCASAQLYREANTRES